MPVGTSASAAADAANQSSGGIIVNKPNVVGWIVGGVVVLFAMVFYFKNKRGGK